MKLPMVCEAIVRLKVRLGQAGVRARACRPHGRWEGAEWTLFRCDVVPMSDVESPRASYHGAPAWTTRIHALASAMSSEARSGSWWLRECGVRIRPVKDHGFDLDRFNELRR